MTTAANRLYKYYRLPPLSTIVLGRPAVILPQGESKPFVTTMVISMDKDGQFTTLKEIWMPEIVEDVFAS